MQLAICFPLIFKGMRYYYFALLFRLFCCQIYHNVAILYALWIAMQNIRLEERRAQSWLGLLNVIRVVSVFSLSH